MLPEYYYHEEIQRNLSHIDFSRKSSYKSAFAYPKTLRSAFDVEDTNANALPTVCHLLCAFTGHETSSLPLQILVIPAITVSKSARTWANVRAL